MPSGKDLVHLRVGVDTTVLGPSKRASTAPPLYSRSTPTPILTKRQLEILMLVEEGLRNKEIAERLGVEWSTVKEHLRRAYRRLGVGRRAHAIKRAGELRLI